MTDFEKVSMAVLGALLGWPFGMWLYFKFQPQIDKFLDRTLERWGL